MGRLLQVAGVLGLLAWTGLGAAAWMLVKDRLQITIADGAEAVRQADDPVALLSGQVENLQNDLGALTDGLNTSLQGLADFVAEDGTARGKELQTALTQRIAALEQALEQNRTTWRGDLSAIRTDLAALSKGVSRRASAEPFVAAGAAEPAAVTEPANGGVNQAGDPEGGDPATTGIAAVDPTGGTTEPAPAATEPPVEDEPAAKPRGFLAIALPSRSFSFDASQTWEVIPSLSRVGFDCKSTLHDFTGVTSEVDGTFETNLAKPDKGISGAIACRAGTLTTGLEGRDENMVEHLAASEHPDIRFAPSSFTASSIDEKAQTVEGVVKGTMTIRGVEKQIEMPVKMVVDKSLRLGIEGQAKLLMSDYAVPVPSQLGMISVEDEVQIWINLKLRAKAAGR